MLFSCKKPLWNFHSGICTASKSVHVFQECLIGAVCLIHICLGYNLCGRMHVFNGNAGIHNVHVQIGKDIGNRTAASLVNGTQLACLEHDMIVIHDSAHFGKVFRIGIIGSGLAAGTGIFVVADTLSQEGRILHIEDGFIQRIHSSTDIT